MMKLIVTKVHLTSGVVFERGVHGVKDIQEMALPQYVILFEDGGMIRVFNPEIVRYRTEE